MRALHILRLTAIPLLLSACASEPAGEVTAPPNAAQDIIALERAGLDQWAAGNPVGYAHSAVDDVTYFDDIGAMSRIEGREAWLEYLAALPIPPHRYEIMDPVVQIYGDTGILTLQYQAFGDGDEPWPPWKATSVYRYVDDEWRQVHAHWSLIKEE